MISECSNWHKSNTRLGTTSLESDPLGIMKKSKIDHTTKLYMHKTESILDNESHKILWGFEIQTDHLIPVRRLNIVLMNKKKNQTYHLVDFAVPADTAKIKESENIDKYLDLAKE